VIQPGSARRSQKLYHPGPARKSACATSRLKLSRAAKNLMDGNADNAFVFKRGAEVLRSMEPLTARSAEVSS
jgi:hypothetical protein